MVIWSVVADGGLDVGVGDEVPARLLRPGPHAHGISDQQPSHLRELHRDLDLDGSGIPDADEFMLTYEEVNTSMWGGYERQDPKRSSGSCVSEHPAPLRREDDRLATELSRQYLQRCPLRTALMPGALELLDALTGRAHLHIITNGFEEVQQVKLEGVGHRDRFRVVLSSEACGTSEAGCTHLREGDATAEPINSSSVMMSGDSIGSDMVGARSAGLDRAHLASAGMQDLRPPAGWLNSPS